MMRWAIIAAVLGIGWFCIGGMFGGGGNSRGYSSSRGRGDTSWADFRDEYRPNPDRWFDHGRWSLDTWGGGSDHRGRPSEREPERRRGE